MQLSTLLSQAGTSAGGLPALLLVAESALDRAEQEFRDTAFAPFWDAVEEAARALARFHGTLEELTGNAKYDKTQMATLPSPPPPFHLGVRALPDASATASRMAESFGKHKRTSSSRVSMNSGRQINFWLLDSQQSAQR